MASIPGRRKQAVPSEPMSMLIGDDPSGGGYVSCPSCGRPVADGVVRCAGCGMRILMGVAASRALLFMTTGAVLGLLVGGLSVGWIMSLSRTVEPPPAAIVVHPSPSVAPAPQSSLPVTVNVDPLAASALRQIASTDAQLASSLSTLKRELKARPVDTGAISATLRQMSAAATYGSSVVGYLSAWSEASALQGEVGRLYAQVRAVAANGLAARLTSTTAYTSAGNQMVSVLEVLADNRAAEYELGSNSGISLPGAPTPAPSPSDQPAPSS